MLPQHAGYGLRHISISCNEATYAPGCCGRPTCSRLSPLTRHKLRRSAWPTDSPTRQPREQRVAGQDGIAGDSNGADQQSVTPYDTPVDWQATGKVFAFPALAGLLFGYDIGAASGVTANLTSAWLSGTEWGPHMTALQSGLLVGMSLFGAMASSAIVLLLQDKYGRRTELLIAAACYVAGGLLMGTASSYELLLTGRAIYGLGIGWAMHAAPAYIAETSPASVRGLLVSCKEAVIVGGILLGYLCAYGAADEVGGWRSMYDLAVPLAGLLALGTAFFLPETPRWLLLAGKGREAAAAALCKAEGRHATERPQYVQQQLDDIMHSLELSSNDSGSVSASTHEQGSNSSHISTKDSAAQPLPGSEVASSSSSSSSKTSWVLGQPRYWRPLAVGCSLMLFQQVTGQPSVLYRAASILQDAGFQAGKGAASIAVLLGAFKVFMTIVAVTQVDSWGRRPLLLTGASGMVLALLVLGAAQSGWMVHMLQPAAAAAAPELAWVSAAALLLYVGCYQISYGPISWLLVGELFPLRARGQAIAVASLVNFGGNSLVSTVLPTLQQTLGLSWAYFLFAAVGVLAVVCIAATVPETKGKTLEQIEAMWDAKRAD